VDELARGLAVAGEDGGAVPELVPVHLRSSAAPKSGSRTTESTGPKISSW
jgi:hypothetical protein